MNHYVAVAALIAGTGCVVGRAPADAGRTDSGPRVVADGGGSGSDAGSSDGGDVPDGGGIADGGGTPDAGTTDGGPVVQTMGLNDITFLYPFDAGVVPFLATDPAADGTALIPQNLFQQVTHDPLIPGPGSDTSATLDQFEIFAVRFDLCDRATPGPCPAGSDGRMRVVFQPGRGAFATGVADMGLHAFYTLPAAQMPAIVASLRQLARLQGEPISSPLKVSPALARDPTGPYATQLRQLIAQNAGTNRLTRLTFLGQPDFISAIAWKARGVELQGTGFAAIAVPGMDGGDPFFPLDPTPDLPAGMQMATDDRAWLQGSPQQRSRALAALAEAQNPLLNSPGTVSCFACHVATQLIAERAGDAGVDPRTIPGTYTSGYDLSTDGGLSATDRFFVRGLGWRGDVPLISQSVVNQTAQALSEIEAAFPP